MVVAAIVVIGLVASGGVARAALTNRAALEARPGA